MYNCQVFTNRKITTFGFCIGLRITYSMLTDKTASYFNAVTEMVAKQVIIFTL